MVKLPEFFGMVAQTAFEGRCKCTSVSAGRRRNGTRTLTIPKEDVLAAKKRDLAEVRNGAVAKAGL